MDEKQLEALKAALVAPAHKDRFENWILSSLDRDPEFYFRASPILCQGTPEHPVPYADFSTPWRRALYQAIRLHYKLHTKEVEKGDYTPAAPEQVRFMLNTLSRLPEHLVLNLANPDTGNPWKDDLVDMLVAWRAEPLTNMARAMDLAFEYWLQKQRNNATAAELTSQGQEWDPSHLTQQIQTKTPFQKNKISGTIAVCIHQQKKAQRITANAQLFYDTRLTATTRMLICYVMNRPRNCNLDKNAAAKFLDVSETTVQRCFKQLQEYGYAEHSMDRNVRGQIQEHIWTFWDCPDAAAAWMDKWNKLFAVPFIKKRYPADQLPCTKAAYIAGRVGIDAVHAALLCAENFTDSQVLAAALDGSAWEALQLSLEKMLRDLFAIAPQATVEWRKNQFAKCLRRKLNPETASFIDQCRSAALTSDESAQINRDQAKDLVEKINAFCIFNIKLAAAPEAQQDNRKSEVGAGTENLTHIEIEANLISQ